MRAAVLQIERRAAEVPNRLEPLDTALVVAARLLELGAPRVVHQQPRAAPGAIATPQVAVAELRAFPPAGAIAELFGPRDRLGRAIDVVERVRLDVADPEIRIVGLLVQLRRLFEPLDRRLIRLARGVAAAALRAGGEAEQMPLADQLPRAQPAIARREGLRPVERLARLAPVGGTHRGIVTPEVGDHRVGHRRQAAAQRLVDAQPQAGIDHAPLADA